MQVARPPPGFLPHRHGKTQEILVLSPGEVFEQIVRMLSIELGDRLATHLYVELHGTSSAVRCSARMSSSVRVKPAFTNLRSYPAASSKRTSADTLMSPWVRFSMR